MLLSAMAVTDLRVRCGSLLEGLQRCFIRGSKAYRAAATSSMEWEEQSYVSLLPEPALPSDESATDNSGDYRWRRHPQLLRESAAYSLSEEERRARKFAVKGLYCAHNGEIEEAFLFFEHALSEHAIDLTEMPSFWQMPRAALIATADAYEKVGRLRESSALRARVRTELRPRNVVPIRRVTDDEARQRLVGGD